MRDKNLKDDVKCIIEEMQRQSIEEIVFYDMKDQWIEELVEIANGLLKELSVEKLNLKKITPLQKQCCYNLEVNKVGPALRKDCDVSLRAILVYALAFDFVWKDMRGNTVRKVKKQGKTKYKYCFEGLGRYEYRGDTMNSYNTTVHEYFARNDFIMHNPQLTALKNEKYKQLKAKWEVCILDNYESFDAILPVESKTFISLYHTLGNFIPVPFVKGKNKKTGDTGEEFNSPRGMGATNDYWDLALLAIYEWYINNDDEKIQNMLKGEDNVELCKKWLEHESFKGENGEPSWDMFIEKNYMQDFVNINDSSDGEVKAGKYGKPKELWTGHFESYVLKPGNEDDFRQFFINASACIAARGIRIANAIKAKLNEKETETLLSELFDW